MDVFFINLPIVGYIPFLSKKGIPSPNFNAY